MALSFTAVNSQDVWESFLLKHSPQALFQSWPWGQVQEKQKVKLWRVGFFLGKKLVGIAQIIKVNARRGSFLHVRHGPIFENHMISYWRQFTDYVKKLACSENAWFVRVNPLIKDSTVFSSSGFRPAAMHAMDGQLCWVLELDVSEEQLLADMRKTTRYEIKLAQRMGVEIIKTDDPAKSAPFFNLYNETARRHGFVKYEGIKEELEVFLTEGKGTLFFGKYGNLVVGSALVLFYGNQAIYHHGASVASKAPVACLIQWEAIREAKKRGLKLYNFWGIAPEDNPRHPWRGITLFKKGFGGREISYIHAHDLAVSPLYLLSRTIETIRRIRKGY